MKDNKFSTVHIAMCQLEDYIETRLSDGVESLKVKEADSIVIAGMGGELVIHILTQGEEVCRQAKELILQPQSELRRVRRFLRENKYKIIDDRGEAISTAINEMGADVKDTVYIGDSEVDVVTSKNANLPCIAVTWGFRDKNVLKSLNPEYIVDSTSDILRIIERGI